MNIEMTKEQVLSCLTDSPSFREVIVNILDTERHSNAVIELRKEIYNKFFNWPKNKIAAIKQLREDTNGLTGEKLEIFKAAYPNINFKTKIGLLNCLSLSDCKNIVEQFYIT